MDAWPKDLKTVRMFGHCLQFLEMPNPTIGTSSTDKSQRGSSRGISISSFALLSAAQGMASPETAHGALDVEC